MVYRRKGRRGFSFQARTQTGWEQVGTGTDDKALARRIEDMWETLAAKERAWDLLVPILDAGRQRPKQLLSLYDLWIDTKRNLNETRRRLQDVDVTPLVDEYLAVYEKQNVAPNTLAYTENYLKYLFPDTGSRMVSQLSAEWLTERLYAYDAKPNTLRIVHSAWTGFLDYLVMPKRLLVANPMAHVAKPGLSKGLIRFYELDVVEQIVNAQPTEMRRVLFSLIYGTGLERSTTQPLTRADFNEKTHEVRGAGTKTHTRDRIALIADWAWPRVARYLKGFLPNVPLFPCHPDTISDWHLETVRDLKLPEYPLHNARHHWAVRQLRAGTPIAVVQLQLGHANPQITLNTYGPFIPSGADRAKWERAATKHDAERRRASR